MAAEFSCAHKAVPKLGKKKFGTKIFFSCKATPLGHIFLNFFIRSFRGFLAAEATLFGQRN